MKITMSATDTQPVVQADCCNLQNDNVHFQKILDSICRIAIGVFAAVYAPIPFVVSLQVGIFTGITYALCKLYQNKPMLPNGENKPVCAQGYMDFLSGMKFPSPAGTLATAVFIAAHTRHDPSFYSPFCGLFIGFWLGRQGTMQGRNLLGYAVNYLSSTYVESKPTICSCKIQIS